MTFLNHLELPFFTILRLSAMASILIGIVMVLQWTFRKRFSPNWHYMLWMLVVLRLTLPWSIETSLSPFNWVPETIPVLSMSSLGSISTTNIAETNPIPTQSPVEESTIQPVSNTHKHSNSFVSVMLIVWLGGVLLFYSHAISRYWNIARRVSKASQITDSGLLDSLETCCRELRIHKKIPLLDVPGYKGIALYGLWQPRIVASRTVLNSLSESELRHVWMHELTHLKQRDIAISWLCVVLQGLHWFNPIIWYGFYRMRLDQEAAIDYHTLQQTGTGLAYGRTLLTVFEKTQTPKPIPGVLGIVENRSFLKRRIAMISYYASHTHRYPFVGLVILVLLGGIFLSGAQSQTPKADIDEVYPYVIPIEMYHKSWSAFQPGDEIVVTEFRGTSPHIEEGESYRVTGTYVLDSQDDAMLHVYATNGEVKSKQGPVVLRGNGAFVREFTLKKIGDLHVNYYPSDGGEGFGGIYYRRQPKNAGEFDSTIDLSVSDQDLVVTEYKDTDMYRMVVAIKNHGNTITPNFDIYFYQNDPGESNPMTHGGGDLYPDAVWREGSMPFKLIEGVNHVYVKIDPHNKIVESDETNNVAHLRFQTKTLTKVVQVIERLD